MFNGDPFNVSIRTPYQNGAGDQGDISCDAVVEMHELKHRGVKHHYGDTETDVGVRTNQPSSVHPVVDTILYEKQILPDDTLQGIALTHHVTLTDLKRVNKLLNDQDFYALKYIKVPIKRHGLLAERLAQESPPANGVVDVRAQVSDPARRWDDVDDNDNYEADSDDSSDTRSLLVRTLSIRDSLGASGRQSAEARKFLERMDGDLEKIRGATNSYKTSLSEVTATLTCKRINPLLSRSAWNGADCGIRWWGALVCVIIVCLLIPLLYFLHYRSSDTS